MMSKEKQSDAVLETLSALKKEIHDKAVYPCSQGVAPYVLLNTIDGIVQKYINRCREDESRAN